MRKRTFLHALAAGTLLFSGACSDRNEPVAPSAEPESPSTQSAILTSADDPIALGRTVAGFGGFYLDEGTPVVYLTDASQRGDAERALAPFLRARGLASSQIRVLPAKYTWAQLERWFDHASAEVLAASGSVFVDADESSNRVLIGVEHGAAQRIRGIVARLGIPESGVIIQETEPIHFAATLRGRGRPVVGGLQINFPGFLCTLGFSAIRNGQSSFVTNSHCTNTQGGTEGTPYWQPTQSSATAPIGIEVSDPTYFRNRNGCPGGRRCRFSDAARAAYASAISSNLGKIARTTGPNNNSVTISSSFSVTGEGSASVGQTVNKVGRTSGWTQGKVTNRCVNIEVSGTDIVYLCQNIVSARVRAGDSGAPVFKGTTGVILMGILWGGNSSGTQYGYSPMSNIERELGALTTF